jgi:large-conductance mechanosensitive channel
MKQDTNIKISSNRNFGLVFFIVFLIVSIWPLTYDEPVRFWSAIISSVFLILGLMNSKLLTPLNKLWFKFGMILGAIVSPVVMGVVFFLVVTPIGLIMKIMGKDLLNKKYDKKKRTYWIKRDQLIGTMKRQF